MNEQFTTRDGVTMEGKLVRAYSAFEGGMRYIFVTRNGEYRCVKDSHGNYVEYVA